MPMGLFNIPAVIPLQRGTANSVAYARANFWRAYCSAFSITCSMLKVVESNTKASAAGTSGATARLRSRSSRSLISAKRRSKLTLKPFSCNCSMRRCARSSEEASRKIFTGASGIPPFPCRGHRQSDLVIRETRVGDAIMLHERVGMPRLVKLHSPLPEYEFRR